MQSRTYNHHRALISNRKVDKRLDIIIYKIDTIDQIKQIGQLLYERAQCTCEIENTYAHLLIPPASGICRRRKWRRHAPQVQRYVYGISTAENSIDVIRCRSKVRGKRINESKPSLSFSLTHKKAFLKSKLEE